jgi:hypothetical protein
MTAAALQRGACVCWVGFQCNHSSASCMYVCMPLLCATLPAVRLLRVFVHPVVQHERHRAWQAVQDDAHALHATLQPRRWQPLGAQSCGTEGALAVRTRRTGEAAGGHVQRRAAAAVAAVCRAQRWCRRCSRHSGCEAQQREASPASICLRGLACACSCAVMRGNMPQQHRYVFCIVS